MVEPKGRFDWLRSFLSSLPRTRAPLSPGDSRGSSDGARPASTSADARVRGDDEPKQGGTTAPVYIAAKRGEPKRRDGRGSGS